MALSSTSIAAKAALLLVDETNIRWTIPEVAKWINAGCKELVLLKPTALAANVAMLLTAGTKQSLIGATFKSTVDGSAVSVSPIQLLDATRNLGATGIETAAGNAVTLVDRQVMDVVSRGWHSATTAWEIKHVMFDPRDPKSFYVYPKATASPAMYLEIVVSKAPTNTLLDSATSLGTSDIDAGIDEIYEGVLVDYVLYRAYAKDAEFTANASRSQWHYEAFRAALGAKLANETGLAPGAMFQEQRPVAR
jgi:hypothetical protein